ncbi:MAG: sigma-70 family RNA polymerase sigma factor, partial [Chitinophagaceae bacterium]
MQLLNPQNWVTLYSDYLYHFALSRVNQEDLAQDLVQDTFLAALRAMDGYKGNSAEKTWLCSILKNKIIDHYRSSFKQTQSLEEENFQLEEGKDRFSDAFFEEVYKGWTPDSRPQEWSHPFPTMIEKKEFYAILKNCLSILPESWAAVFTLKNLEELSSEEICKELQISPSNLYT